MRDGISEVEIEDLLSVDATILTESVLSQLSNHELANVDYPIPRISSIVFSSLLHDIVTVYSLMSKVPGRGRGPPLLKFKHAAIKETATKRYLADTDLVEIAKADICSYFGNAWGQEEEEGRESTVSAAPRGQRISLYLKGAHPKGGDWKGILNPFKYVSKQPTCLSSGETSTLYNYRKIRELPRMLVLTQKWNDLQKLFEDFYFVEGLLRVQGIELAIDEINLLQLEGKKANMPMNLQIHLRHLAIFLRHRIQWISAHEATPGMHPDGLWLQEIRNIPSNFMGSFAEALISSMDECWTDILTSRGGRIEFENGWKPDNETYGPMPFRHINIQCCAISNDGKYLATGSSDGVLKVWDIVSGEELRTFLHLQPNASAGAEIQNTMAVPAGTPAPTSSGITAICFSNERPANVIVSAAHDPKAEPSIKMWSWRSSSFIPKTLLGAHTSGSMVVSCEFLAPENRRLMSVSTDFTVVLWEVARGRIIRMVPVPQIDEALEFNGHLAYSSRKSQPSVPVIFKRRRLYPSGWPRLCGCVGPNGLFAFGSSTITVMDPRWKELFTKDLCSEKDKLRRQRLTAAAFSSDGTAIFAASATPPDDAQMISVEIQTRAERQFSQDEDTKLSSGRSKSNLPVSNIQLSDVSNVAQETEAEVKRLKMTCIRSWNIDSGQLLLTILIEDYITSISICPTNNYLLCGGAKGVITVWDSITGEHVLTREGHTSSVAKVLWFPPPQKTIKAKRKNAGAPTIESNVCDDMWTYSTPHLNNTSISASKSKSLNSMHFATPAYQFVTAGLDDNVLAWSLDGISAEPGQTPIVTAVFNHTGEWLLTVGGAPLSTSPRAHTLIRLWETSTATVRCRIELPETQRSEVIWASFLPRDDTRIVLGCKNGLVKVYRSRTGELVREFWADAETAFSEAVLGYSFDWPFAATGTFIVGYAMHPEGKVIAVAVAGQERFPSQSSTAQDPKVTFFLANAVQNNLDAAGLGDVAKMASHSGGRKSVADGIDPDKSSDTVLRDCIRLTFWDLDGNPLRVDNSFNLPIFFNSSDHSCTFGPASTKPSLNRLNNFVIKWSHDGRSLFVSDDVEILKECTIEIRGSNVYGQTHCGWWWKSTVSPPPSKMTIADCLSPSINAASIGNLAPGTSDQLDVYRTLNVSAATACSSVLHKSVDNLCFAYGNGIIGWRKTDTHRGAEEVRWFLGHCGLSGSSGGVIGCEYIPNISGKGNYSSQPKHGDPSGLIVSASKNGTVLIQDCFSKEVCAVFNVGCPLKAMSVCPMIGRQNLGISDRLRIVLSKADGTLALLRYFP
ncbi:U3 small nucleolar RNA-associated protein 13 [Phlyctochytrium planicorne]|nr:U3 small nucleolar RNA-associated protein 13 [Phlyctochytrium planicorne]